MSGVRVETKRAATIFDVKLDTLLWPGVVALPIDNAPAVAPYSSASFPIRCASPTTAKARPSSIPREQSRMTSAPKTENITFRVEYHQKEPH